MRQKNIRSCKVLLVAEEFARFYELSMLVGQLEGVYNPNIDSEKI